jgi:hypothetical protein
MNRVILFQDSKPQMGLRTRIATTGDEYNLVKQFIEYYVTIFSRYDKTNNLAIFVEPRIESGFPDVVFAIFRPSILNNWSDERKKLDINDFKVLSFLCYTRNAKGANIISKLGLHEKQTIFSLEKLMSAKLISYRNNYWKARELRDIFSIKKLVAVEAKLNNVNKVIGQSFINTWFASHSYALTNTVKPQNETVQTFSRCGIGLYCKGKQFNKVVEAKRYSLPSSYQSFLFNEWIGNTIASNGEK